MSKEIYTRDVSVLEERELLQQIVSLGVGYPYVKSWGSNAALTDRGTLHAYVSRLASLQRLFGTGSMTREEEKHIQSGEDGHYLIDLYNGCILSRGKHPIEDIIIEFILLDTNDRVQIRRRKGTHLHDMAFLISPNGVFFVGGTGAYLPLNEFHMISFINLENSEHGFVVDYDAAQNNRPLVLFPCKENYDIIQDLLDKDDHIFKKERKAFLKHIGVDWKE